jgi:Fe-S-cluster containining protein
MQNLCVRCGACCAFYKVSFDCLEVDDVSGGVVPVSLTVKISASRSAMRGTEKNPVRCGALKGKIGHAVSCSIYDWRPTTCRQFLSLWDHGVVNSLCDRARASYGLNPLGYF